MNYLMALRLGLSIYPGKTIVAFLETRVTNGVIEGINGLLRFAKRMAPGFRSFRHFRLMALLKAG